MSHANYFGFSLENTTAIEITVGPKDEEVSWILPKDLLTHDSDFFKAALNGTFAEANSRSISMPEDNPKAFRLFFQWLYFRDITLYDAEEWLEAWVLGDKIGNIAFRDCAMTKLINHHELLGISPTTVENAFNKSVSGSKLRKWAIEQLVYDSVVGSIYIHAEEWASKVDPDVLNALDQYTEEDVENPFTQINSYLGE